MLHEVFSEDTFAAGLTITMSVVITRTDAVC